MADTDALTAAREKVLDWGPDLRLPARMERFRRDVAELERLAAEWAVWNAAAEYVASGFAHWPDDSGQTVIATDADGRIWSPEEVGEALGAVAKAAAERGPRPIRPLPVPGHRGPLQGDGGPWTCALCGWVEGDPPSEHEHGSWT